MQVRILTARPGYLSGAVVDLDEATARVLIGRGDAEPVATVPDRRVVPVETATAEPDAETAVTHRRRGRR